MNKFFLRNRINISEKPSQKAYLQAIIEKWGGAELLKSLRNEFGDLDKELLKQALWEVKTYSEIKPLGAIFTHSPSSNTQYYPDILSDSIHKEKLNLPGFQDLVSKIAIEAKPYFNKNSFEDKNIGKLISTLLIGQSSPNKLFSTLEILLFGSADTIGFIIKAKLIGQEEFLRRIDKANTLINGS